jgi:hypothetical protein
MSERAALDLLCSISDRFTELCLYMTIACEWRAMAGRDGTGNARRMRAQPKHSNLAAYVLHAVQPVCATGMLANFNQTLEAW